MLGVGLLGALPTLVAVFFSPELILDDLQFASTAAFDGMGGFVDEMSYRPGQGLVHGVQFVAFGTNAVLHLLLLAAVNALNAVLGFRLARYWMPPRTAAAVMAAWLLLPDRGSTRYWVSTVPNHVALASVLLAALLVSQRWRAMNGRTWAAVGALLMGAVVTYEAVGLLAAAVVVMGVVGGRETLRPTPKDLVAPMVVAGGLGAASLFVLARSPRGGASTLLADPGEGVSNYLTSLDTVPLGSIGPLLLLAVLAWAVIDRRPAMARLRWIVLVGVAVALAGLAPFVVAGFNVQNLGVLDRSLFFAGIGSALVLGAGLRVIDMERRAAGRLGQRLVVGGGMLLFGAAAVAVVDDLSPFRAAWSDQQRASAALVDAQPQQLGLVDGNGPQRAVLVDIPIDAGVAWAHYDVQVQDLYQLVNRAEEAPAWLGLSWEEPLDDHDVAVTIDGIRLRER